MGAYKNMQIVAQSGANKKESFFWDTFGINNVCKVCTKGCKQHGGVELMKCPYYVNNGNPIEAQTIFTKYSKPNRTAKKRVTKEKVEKVKKTRSVKPAEKTDKKKKTFKRAKVFVITHTDGRVERITNVAKYVRENNLDYKLLLYTIVKKTPYEGRIVTKEME